MCIRDRFRRQGQHRSGLAAYLTDRFVPERARRRLLQSVSRTFPCQQWLAMARIKESADCPHCLRRSASHRETMGHIQCACPSLERARIAAHHHIWRGLLAMLAASSQPILVPSGTRWTKKTGRPTGDVIDDANFLARVKQGHGTVSLTEAEMTGKFSKRHLAKGYTSAMVMATTGCPRMTPRSSGHSPLRPHPLRTSSGLCLKFWRIWRFQH